MVGTTCLPQKAARCMNIRNLWRVPIPLTNTPSKLCRMARSSVTSTLLTPICRSRAMERWWTPRPASGITPPYAVVRGVMIPNRPMAPADGAHSDARPPSRKSNGMRTVGRAWSEVTADSVTLMLRKMPSRLWPQRRVTNMMSSIPASSVRIGTLCASRSPTPWARWAVANWHCVVRARCATCLTCPLWLVAGRHSISTLRPRCVSIRRTTCRWQA